MSASASKVGIKSFGDGAFDVMVFSLCSAAQVERRRTDDTKLDAPLGAERTTSMSNNAPPEFNPETAPPRLEIDWDAYLPFFEDEDIPEDQKRELIEALWGNMVSFVDLGFGVAPARPPAQPEALRRQRRARPQRPRHDSFLPLLSSLSDRTESF